MSLIHSLPMIEITDGIPYSPLYGDIYYMRREGEFDGLKESRYVFLEGNALADKWSDMDSSSAVRIEEGAEAETGNQTTRRDCYVIAETGFGTGLNFLAAWQLWSQQRQYSRHCPPILHYISIEKHPLTGSQLNLCHREFPELQEYSSELVSRYPEPLTGFHRLWLNQHQVCLTLCFMDVSDALDALIHTVNKEENTTTALTFNAVDSWLLDGFAPNKNPDIWSLENIQKIARLSHSDTSLATFTAAGAVRRHLTQSGFEVAKRPGFGRKREMVTANFTGNIKAHQLVDSRKEKPTPWYGYFVHGARRKTVTVIGAGIAGCQVAWHLAQRNYEVTVVERHSAPATEASGNPLGIISAKVSSAPSLSDGFYRQCFQYTLNQLNELGLDQESWSPCGVMQLVTDHREEQRWTSLLKRGLPTSFLQCLDERETNNVSGVSLGKKAIFLPQGGWISPRRLCRKLLDHDAIHLITQNEVTDIHHDGEQWQVIAEDKPLLSSPTVVIASGKHWHLAPMEPLPHLPISGQTTQVNSTTESEALRVVIDHKGYLTPAVAEHHLIGATYEKGVSDVDLSPSADRENIQKQREHLGEFATTLGQMTSAHAATRVVSPDRFPYVGALPDFSEYEKSYANMNFGRSWRVWPTPKYHPGLYISSAFGSRGLTTAGLSAELLACLINNEPLPISRNTLHALHPARYFIKSTRRGKK